MITAYAVVLGPHEPPAIIQDRARAELVAANRHGTLHKLVDEAAILRKFDGYVPADQVASLRWRVVELEAALQSAHARLTDMLMGDDGQAWREAERALPKIAAALPAQHLACATAGRCTADPQCQHGRCARAAVPLVSGPIVTDRAAIADAFERDDDTPHGHLHDPSPPV